MKIKAEGCCDFTAPIDTILSATRVMKADVKKLQLHFLRGFLTLREL